MDKKSIRKIALCSRINYASDIINNYIVLDIINSKVLEKCRNVGIYYPLKSEINILKLVDYYKNINFYLPKTEEHICFYRYNENKLQKGKYNIFEPIDCRKISRDEIDAFIIPCVATTKDYKRIGYGKGYYDRYLENYNGIKIGVVYKELSNVDCDTSNYDISLDYIFRR